MTVSILIGDCRDRMRAMEPGSVQCCVTSPPYFGLRDYGHAGQIGLEATPDEFVAAMVEVFREVRRVLADDGTVWLNLGDSYARGFGGGSPGDKSATNVGSFKDRTASKIPDGLKGKDLIGIPWMVAFALRADGWFLRQDIIWAKPNPMPESVTDRCTKAHEYVFLLSRSGRYYYNDKAVAEPLQGEPHAPGNKGAPTVKEIRGANAAKGMSGQYAEPERVWSADGLRNKRSVWTVATQPFKEAHFATYPPALIEPCILAGCRAGGTVLDPFGGAGTTGLVADRLGRNAVLIELNPAYAEIARNRIVSEQGMFVNVDVAA